MAENLDLAGKLERVRATTPLVHCITNYVTVNDVANILLACGGSPIMSDECKDVTDIQAICGGLVLNIGTLNTRTISGMFVAGHTARECGHTILLDPVGAGASNLRTKTALDIIEQLSPDVIRGNISEIKCLAEGTRSTRGVDADAADAVDVDSADDLAATIQMARRLAAKTGAIVVITGATDLIVNKKNACAVTNGNVLMSTITGSGCMLSALMEAYCIANPDDLFGGCVAATCLMGLAGERAAARFEQGVDGNSSYRNYLIDAVYNITAGELEQGAAYTMI